MENQAVLALFDSQVRRNPDPELPDATVERDDRVIRVVHPASGWHGVAWTDLDGLDGAGVDAAIAAQIARFAAFRRPWEWKHYSYDRPADLPDRLRAAGFVPEPEEAMLVAEIADLALDVPPPAGVRLLPVTDERGVRAMARVHDEVFGAENPGINAEVAARLASRPGEVPAVVAMAGDTPVCAGRVDYHYGTAFASIWSGGTVPAWRGRGVFRAVVARRAALAAAAGYRYLQVDASADSRPILRRLGFVDLATTTPFVHPGG